IAIPAGRGGALASRMQAPDAGILRGASMRMSSLAASLVLALATAASATAAEFDLQGHRGTRGNAPENTIAAFEKALAIGVTTLEMDAAITADGVVVVSHDPAL